MFPRVCDRSFRTRLVAIITRLHPPPIRRISGAARAPRHASGRLGSPCCARCRPRAGPAHVCPLRALAAPPAWLAALRAASLCEVSRAVGLRTRASSVLSPLPSLNCTYLRARAHVRVTRALSQRSEQRGRQTPWPCCDPSRASTPQKCAHAWRALHLLPRLLLALPLLARLPLLLAGHAAKRAVSRRRVQDTHAQPT